LIKQLIIKVPRTNLKLFRNLMYRIYTILSLVIMLMASSCMGPKKTVYFKDNIPNDPRVIVQQMDRVHEAIVQPDDILSIHISTISSIVEASAATIFNEGGAPYAIVATSGGGGGTGGAGGGVGKGYLVDPSGLIDYPVIGKIKVGGLTIRQIKDALTLKLKDYVKDPVAEVNILNYKITVLGEVGRPGTVIAPNHKINVIDAIASAGDIPISGKKDNILVIRETEGNREFARLNLNSRDVFKSPYFYLKQNDILYVEPNSIRKQEGSDFFRLYLPAITSLISTVLAVYGVVQISNIKN
jgi:polysaccharide export outer membrane protein